jgi:hypothetical protein
MLRDRERARSAVVEHALRRSNRCSDPRPTEAHLRRGPRNKPGYRATALGLARKNAAMQMAAAISRVMAEVAGVVSSRINSSICRASSPSPPQAPRHRPILDATQEHLLQPVNTLMNGLPPRMNLIPTNRRRVYQLGDRHRRKRAAKLGYDVVLWCKQAHIMQMEYKAGSHAIYGCT